MMLCCLLHSTQHTKCDRLSGAAACRAVQQAVVQLATLRHVMSGMTLTCCSKLIYGSEMVSKCDAGVPSAAAESCPAACHHRWPSSLLAWPPASPPLAARMWPRTRVVRGTATGGEGAAGSDRAGMQACALHPGERRATLTAEHWRLCGLLNESAAVTFANLTVATEAAPKRLDPPTIPPPEEDLTFNWRDGIKPRDGLWVSTPPQFACFCMPLPYRVIAFSCVGPVDVGSAMHVAGRVAPIAVLPASAPHQIPTR